MEIKLNGNMRGFTMKTIPEKSVSENKVAKFDRMLELARRQKMLEVIGDRYGVFST